MVDKKYILTDKTRKIGEHILYRIKAVKDFGDVRKGELGGYVESESNLSHSGCCWIYNNACAYGNAKIDGDAVVFNDAKVYGNAEISDGAKVYDYAKVYGNAEISDGAKVYGYAEVYGNAKVCCRAAVFGNVRIYGYANVYGNVMIFGKARVFGNADIFDGACICGKAKVKSNKDYAVFKNTWSSYRYFTWTRSDNMWKVGCFHGTGEELIKKAYEDSEISGKCYEAIVKAQEIISNVN